MTQSGQQRRCPHAGPWHHGATAPCTSQAAAAAAVPAQAGTQAPPARDSILCCPAPATTVVADPRQPLSPPSRAGHSCRRRRPAPDTAASPPRAHLLHRSVPPPRRHQIRTGRGRICGHKPPPPQETPTPVSTRRGRAGRTRHAPPSQGRQPRRRRPLTPRGIPRGPSGGGATGRSDEERGRWC
jgi:hypothetical protein